MTKPSRFSSHCALVLLASLGWSQNSHDCSALPDHSKLKSALITTVKEGENANGTPVDPSLDPTIDWSHQNEVELDRP